LESGIVLIFFSFIYLELVILILVTYSKTNVIFPKNDQLKTYS